MYICTLDFYNYLHIIIFSYIINNIIIPVFCYKYQNVEFWEKEVKAQIKELAPMKRDVNTLESVKVTTATYIQR